MVVVIFVFIGRFVVVVVVVVVIVVVVVSIPHEGGSEDERDTLVGHLVDRLLDHHSVDGKRNKNKNFGDNQN